jgi:serine/threonine protein kinase
MELLHGGNLDEVDKLGWALARKLEVMSRVCMAVAYSHANGVIHRDVKPANIVLNYQGQPVLTDFDIADVKFATSMSTTVEGGLGTPVFAAPEQLEDADLANERSDVYSLGRLLLYLLIERSPGYQVDAVESG